MAKHSRYQEKIIKRYYENRDAISLQRAQEILTELYLAEGKKREQQWKLMLAHLEKLGVQQARIDKLAESKDVAAVAKLVEELVKKG